MGPLGSNEKKKKKMIETVKNNSNMDFSDAGETQPIDSQFSPPDELGGEFEDENNDGLQYVQDTLLVNDIDPFGDEIETQMVDLGGPTEVVDFYGETQVVHLGGETQVLDECDTEVFADTDDEGSGKTEVLCDTQVLSDDDSVKKSRNCSVDQESSPNNGCSKQRNEDAKSQSDALNNGEHSSGSMLRGFTSLRAASMRASGLAARRSMALKRTKSPSCFIKSDNSLEHQNAEKDGTFISRDPLMLGNEFDQKYGQEGHDEHIEESRYGNMRKVGSSTVRKLFMDAVVSDVRKADDGMKSDNREGSLQLFASENGLAGLSYIDSQEPGELSQANALDVVDRFLELNAIESDKDVAFRESTSGELRPISSAKGTQFLAKKAITKSIAGERGAFDWDNNLEDEGGGEFLKKKKELFFDNSCQRGRSVKHSRKSCLKSKGSMTVEIIRDKEYRLDILKKLKDPVFSDSKLLSKDLRTDGETSELTKVSFKKNLMKDLGEQINDASYDGCVDDGTDKNVPEMLDVGFDTQMAADAMENLRFAVSVTNNDCNNGNDNTKIVSKSSEEVEARKRSNVQKTIDQKGAGSSDAGVVTRNSKNARRTGVRSHRESPLLSVKQSKKERKQLDGQRVKREPKRAKLNPKDFDGNGRSIKAGTFKTLDDKGKFCQVDSGQSGKLGNVNRQPDHSNMALLDCPRRPRTRSMLKLVGQEDSTEYNTRSRRSKTDAISTSMVNKDSKDYISSFGVKRIHMLADGNSSGIQEDVIQAKTSKLLNVRRRFVSKRSSDWGKANGSLEASPRDRCKPSASASTTPVSCTTPVNAASPICMGDEYQKLSCRKNLARSSLTKEINSLIKTSPEIACTIKESRKRRDMADVRVMFSHHLDADIIKQQKKILNRLGASEASLMSDASHFITDYFVRTRNMLEAIAFGKPVVTHLWLDSCGQASCFIDERNYILRDARKEKEFGFSMPVSLARACQHPILKGQKVLITPNTKPGKEILASLVKAVHGLAVERLGRSSLKDKKLPHDLLILSCEEDYELCVPYLERGVAVYSSELLLNGIVTQRLEYERHMLFTDNVKRTRSTIWLKRNNKYFPVNKSN